MDEAKSSTQKQLFHQPQQQKLDSTTLRNMSLEELERLLIEKRLFLNRLEAVTCNLPVRIETRSAEIQHLMEQVEQLRQQNALDTTNFNKTIRGVETVKLLLELTEAEVRLRKNSISDLVELSPSEWNELDKLGSMFGSMDTASAPSLQPPIETSVEMKSTLNLSKPKSPPAKTNIYSTTPAGCGGTMKTTNLSIDVKDGSTSNSGFLRASGRNPSLPSSKPVQWTVPMTEDFQISKSIASRWHITKSSHVFKPLLAGYHNGRIAKDFTVVLPHLEACAPNTLDCVACNKRIDTDLRVRLVEYCEDCSFHPMCAAVHLDFCATNVDIMHDEQGDGSAMTCIGRVFGKCPNSKKSDVISTTTPAPTTTPPTVSSKRHSTTTASVGIRSSKFEQSGRKRVKEV